MMETLVERKHAPLVMSLEDVCLWPNDTWCYASELHEMQHMSDDYRRIAADTPDWLVFHDADDE